MVFQLYPKLLIYFSSILFVFKTCILFSDEINFGHIFLVILCSLLDMDRAEVKDLSASRIGMNFLNFNLVSYE